MIAYIGAINTEEMEMTLEQIRRLPTGELKAIVRTTNPNGPLWVEAMCARDELIRRSEKIRALQEAALTNVRLYTDHPDFFPTADMALAAIEGAKTIDDAR